MKGCAPDTGLLQVRRTVLEAAAALHCNGQKRTPNCRHCSSSNQEMFFMRPAGACAGKLACRSSLLCCIETPQRPAPHDFFLRSEQIGVALPQNGRNNRKFWRGRTYCRDVMTDEAMPQGELLRVLPGPPPRLQRGSGFRILPQEWGSARTCPKRFSVHT